MSNSETVDPLSLTLSLQDEADERVLVGARSADDQKVGMAGTIRMTLASHMALDSVLLLCIVGSTVHGLAVQDGLEDRDVMGICCEPPEPVIGLTPFEQWVGRTKAWASAARQVTWTPSSTACGNGCGLPFKGRRPVGQRMFQALHLLGRDRIQPLRAEVRL